MGESKTISIARRSAAVTIGLAASALLVSCSGLGAGPGSVAPAVSDSAPAASASVPSTSAPADPSTSPSPDPSPASSEPAVVATPDATAAAAQKAVVPFITSATWDADHGLDVSAIVPEVVEKGGTCTVTAVKGDATATKRGPAVAAASYTGCQQLAIDPADLTPGTWQVHLSYSSDDSAGTSVARTVTVG